MFTDVKLVGGRGGIDERFVVLDSTFPDQNVPTRGHLVRERSGGEASRQCREEANEGQGHIQT